MCPRRNKPAAQPRHAPAEPSDEKHEARQEADRQLTMATKAREAAQRKYERMKNVVQELMRQTRDCPGNDIPVQEIELLLQQAENEEQSGRSAEEFLTEGISRIEAELRSAYEDRYMNYPVPEFLSPSLGPDTINVAVSGGPDAGKSSFINTIRDLNPGHPEAEDTSAISQCTMEPTRVEHRLPLYGVTINIWDLPGGGTKEFPVETYVKDMGLRYFDCVVCFTARTVLEAETKVIGELKQWNVPHFVVRNKVDLAIRSAVESKEDDAGEELSRAQKKEIEEDTLDKIKQELVTKQGLASKVYLIASRLKHRSDWDFQELKRDIVAAVKTGRKVDVGKECPVCFEEYADYGGEAGLRVTAPCDHSACRTCWPSLRECSICRGPLVRDTGA